jgi:RsiW-degrading membrane proteinase PrsW (M82 family)
MAFVSTGTNPIKIARQIVLRLGFYFGLLWLIQAVADHGQVPYRILVVIAIAWVSLSFMIDLLLPSGADDIAQPTAFDRKSLRQAMHIAIGGTAGFAMGDYYRNHPTYSVSGWAVCITIYLIGGFVGGYGPIRLTRALAAIWRGKATSSASSAPKGAA